MRRASIDLLEHFSCGCVAFKSRQRRDVRFLARQGFKLVLLTRSFLLRPATCCVTCDCFDPANASGDRFFLHDPEGADFAGGSHMGPAAKLARVAVDLDDAHDVAVLLAKKLDDILSFPSFSVRNFSPRNRRIFRDLFVH